VPQTILRKEGPTVKIGEHHGFDSAVDAVYFLFSVGLVIAILTSGWRIMDLLIEF
jgi:hypothetical protein